MSAQPIALWLANKLEDMPADGHWLTVNNAAAELRRLHSVNADLLEALKWMVDNDDTNEGDDPVERIGGQSWNEFNAYWLDGLNKARSAIAKATGETK